MKMNKKTEERFKILYKNFGLNSFNYEYLNLIRRRIKLNENINYVRKRIIQIKNKKGIK